MQQSSSGILVSLILIVGLAVAFAVGIRYLGAGFAANALPAPTATVRPAVVVGPSTSGSGGPGGQTHGVTPTGRRQPTPTPTVRPTATPAPTPAAQVVMAKSLGAGETAAEQAASFPVSAYKVYCVATFAKVGPNDLITFRYMSRDSNTEIWHSAPSDITPPITAPSTHLSRAVFFQGPFNAGKYSCDVLLNGRVVGSAPYTMQ